MVKRPNTSHTVGFPTADLGRAQAATCYKTDTAMFNTTVQCTAMAATDCQFKLAQSVQCAQVTRSWGTFRLNNRLMERHLQHSCKQQGYTGGGDHVRPSVCQHQQLSWIFMNVTIADINWKLWSRREVQKTILPQRHYMKCCFMC